MGGTLECAMWNLSSINTYFRVEVHTYFNSLWIFRKAPLTQSKEFSLLKSLDRRQVQNSGVNQKFKTEIFI